MKVKASEIVTADKLKGRGPQNIVLTAGPNPVSEDRHGVATVRVGNETKSVNINQLPGGQGGEIPGLGYLV